MRLVFFLLLAIVFFAPLDTSEAVDPTRTIILTSLVLLLMGLTAEIPSSYLVHCIYRHPAERYRWARLLQLLRRLHLGIACGMFLSTILICHWPAVVRQFWHLDRALFVDEVVILLPFILGLVSSWSSFYRVERALHCTGEWAVLEPMPSLREFLKNLSRYHLAMMLEPLCVFAAIQSVMQGYDAGWNWWLIIGYGIVCLLAIAWFLPWVWTKAWDTEPLPAGPRRDLLRRLCERLQIPLTNLLLWNTQHHQAAALLVGYLPQPRFVILSDLLVDQLTDEELSSVLAHELGHVRYHHLPVMLVFLLFSLILWTLASWLVQMQLSSSSFLDQLLLQTAMLCAMMLYVRFTLGDLSRRLEREADLMACLAWHDKSPSYGLAVFASTLHKVAQLNGESPDHHSWLHGSITSRLEALELLVNDPVLEHRFSNQMLWLKTGLVAALTSLSIWIVYVWQKFVP
ncbi:MAG TPA: M48 family metallopeptidase [Gemmatales bacterium]|nr:M48 family metallopeptidase [Gemmatales bacterium]